MTLLRNCIPVLLFAIVTTAGTAYSAQSFPAKPVRIVVPFAPGGGVDLMARLLAKGMYESWGYPVVVDHRTGASGNIGTEMVARSAPDGYTLLFHTGSFSINPLIYAAANYDPVKDFAAISLMATGPQLLVAHASVPVTSVKDLVALSKTAKFTYATPGVGTVGHLSGELLRMAAGVQMVHIPYKGSGAAISDLLGGHVQLMFSAQGSVIAHVRSGKLKALAISSAKREPGLDDIPTFAEAGYPSVEVLNWFGLLAPVATSRPIIAQLQAEVVRIVGLPEVRERIISSGYTPVTNSPREFAEFLASESVKWKKLVKEVGVRGE